MVFHCFVLGESPSFPLGRGGSVLEPNSKNRDHFCGTEPNRNRNLRTKEPTVPNFCSYLKKILKFHRGKRKNTDFLSQFIKTFLQNLRFTLSLVGTEPNRNRKFWNRTEPESKVLGPDRTGTDNFGTDPPLSLMPPSLYLLRAGRRVSLSSLLFSLSTPQHFAGVGGGHELF